MQSTRSDWRAVRCLFESPILDEHKWGKIPNIPADAFILDLEDSVPAGQKADARAKVVEYLGKPEYFNGALTVPRCNHLETEWGRDDLIAFAKAGAEVVMYPKTNKPEDVTEVVSILAENGAKGCKVLTSIESAQGVYNAGSIFAHPDAVASTFGSGDLHVDLHIPLYDENDEINPGLLYAKSHTVMAAAASELPVIGIAYLSNIKDQTEARKRIKFEKMLGFSGLCSFYPPQVEIINDVFTPSAEEIERATMIVKVYEAAVAEGNPAIKMPNGEALLVHDYKESQNILARVR